MSLSDPAPTTGRHPGGPRRSETPFPAVAECVRDALGGDSTGHDLHHAWRVFRLGQRLADDLEADRTVVGCAALTHDLHRVIDGGVDPRESLDEVRSVLSDAGLDDDRIDAVEHCVAVHDDLSFRGDDPQPATVEAKLLRDADNLDAIGAIGIARTFAFGGAHGSPMWDPDGETYSQVYHIEDKLLRLDEELHTAPARAIAAGRFEFLETFFDRFLAEWHGDA